MNQTVLVIAAHPINEVLSCGGTIARHVVEGEEVHVIIPAEGATSRDATRNPEAREQELSDLAQAAHKAKDNLGSIFPASASASVSGQPHGWG